MVGRIRVNVSRKVCVVALIVLLVIVLVCVVAKAQTLDNKVEDNVFDFITEVMGIDTAKYEVTHNSYSANYPSNFGGSVKEELTTLTLSSSDGSLIEADVQFNNGYMAAFFYLYGPVVEEQQYNVSSLEKAQGILSRYQNFSSQLGTSSDEVPSALMMLSSVKELSPSSITNGNMKMQITTSEPSINPPVDYDTRIAFYYTANGIDSTRKCLVLEFCRSYGVTQILFVDTWGLFSIYSADLPCLSESEARVVAWDAAKNYQIKLLNTEDNSTISVTPTWPEKTTVESDMDMVTGQLYNDSRLLGLSMGNTSRDGLTLYPLWKFLFYFDKPIGDMQGIQVGVWGDTKEIAYCGTYGFYGTPNNSSSPPLTTPSPMPSSGSVSSQQPSMTTNAPSPEPGTSTSPITSSTALIVASVFAISAVAATAVLILKKRRRSG
ncbi:MAG: hypothetical protein NWF05_02790 [Candidatus Bathyarchaeota archaeon]|nr:hypothetical protein [Candidatus Bathyarchaeota archaeon]